MSRILSPPRPARLQRIRSKLLPKPTLATHTKRQPLPIPPPPLARRRRLQNMKRQRMAIQRASLVQIPASVRAWSPCLPPVSPVQRQDLQLSTLTCLLATLLEYPALLARLRLALLVDLPRQTPTNQREAQRQVPTDHSQWDRRMPRHLASRRSSFSQLDHHLARRRWLLRRLHPSHTILLAIPVIHMALEDIAGTLRMPYAAALLSMCYKRRWTGGTPRLTLTLPRLSPSSSIGTTHLQDGHCYLKQRPLTSPLPWLPHHVPPH